jgi:uridine phosphorylase
MSRFAESELMLNKDGSIYHLNLKPEHITDTIITVGDPGRVYKVSQYFDDVDFEMNKREFITHIGKYKGKRVMVISSGMGTDNIEILMTELDALANIDLKKREEKKEKRRLNIVRIGTSGSLQESIPLGSYLVSDYAVGLGALMFFYNLNMTGFENAIADRVFRDTGLPHKPYCVQGSELLKKKFAFDMVEGNTVTCPGFYAPQGRQLRLDLRVPNFLRDMNQFHYNNFWLTNFEMETAGYYAMGRLLGHDVISLNAIVANRITNKYSKDPDKIVDGLIRKVLDRI